MRLTILFLGLVSSAATGFDAGAAEPSACMNLKGPHASATVSGVLRVRLLAGPPNYESIANGDAEEIAFILELPTLMCADDGKFINGTTRFDRVQVSASDPALLDVLNASPGRPVTVSGEAFGAHTGHHRAPLVLLAEEVTVE